MDDSKAAVIRPSGGSWAARSEMAARGRRAGSSQRVMRKVAVRTKRAVSQAAVSRAAVSAGHLTRGIVVLERK